MSDLISRQAAIDAAEESRSCNPHKVGEVARNHEYEHRHFIALLRSLPPEPQWIPCSERLPKKEYKEQRRGVYLTTNAYGVVGITNYEFEGDFGFVGWGTNRPYDIQIVAWMPLPEPYAERREE